jgi:DNA polymerase type B, organellar and viral
VSDKLRPFVAWDGEAVKNEHEDSNDHPYSLFGSSLGPKIQEYNLKTIDCLNLLIETEKQCPEAIHFGFAFGYDVNMILRELPLAQLQMLRRHNRTRYLGYDIEYIPRKWLRVGYGKGKQRTSLQVFDVFSFFGKGLGPTLRQYNIGTELELERIEAGKGERPNFTFANIQKSIEPYWRTELSLMVRLMDEFRSILYNSGIYIRSWHGPGAIASYLFRNNNIQKVMDRGTTDAILSASRSAYFGGRFEPFMAGYYEGPVYSADINSAYPYSFSRLPSLRDGKWEHEIGRPTQNPRDVRLGLYRIRYAAPYSNRAMPLPHRDPNGSVSFPPITEGWIHAAEAYSVYNDPYAEFLESWVFEDDGSYPFAFVEDLYEQRLALQAANDPTQIAFKLGPNSMYGQVAQRQGWERRNGPPRWHQLEWAGAITSECRSMVYSVARQSNRNLLSIDTDGVLSLKPFQKLPNGAGNNLGQWKTTTYSGVLYVQNGIYWLRDNDGNWLPPKSRGIPRRKLQFENVYPIIKRNEDLEISQHMFIGYGLALRGRMHDWRQWLDEPRKITFGGTGKRIHAVDLCGACKHNRGYADCLHQLSPVPPKRIQSVPHFLPWLAEKESTTDFPSRLRTIDLERWGIWE